MKKDIGFVDMDPSLAERLISILRADESAKRTSSDLMDGLGDLLKGKISALMLEIGGEGSSLTKPNILQCGELVIEPKLRRVHRSGQEITLTPKEFDILYFLAQNRGEIFTKEQIYKAVWSDDYLLDDSNIMAFIRKLRKKIEPDPDSPIYILTIWGIGYKFNDTL